MGDACLAGQPDRRQPCYGTAKHRLAGNSRWIFLFVALRSQSWGGVTRADCVRSQPSNPSMQWWQAQAGRWEDGREGGRRSLSHRIGLRDGTGWVTQALVWLPQAPLLPAWTALLHLACTKRRAASICRLLKTSARPPPPAARSLLPFLALYFLACSPLTVCLPLPFSLSISSLPRLPHVPRRTRTLLPLQPGPDLDHLGSCPLCTTAAVVCKYLLPPAGSHPDCRF